MLDENVFRDEVRKLKALIREDPAVLAQYDTDGNGEIDGAEWDHAVALLRRKLETQPANPSETTQRIFEAVSGVASLATSKTVVIRQAVENREVVLGYETCNRYTFLDGETGRELGGAEESSGGVGGFFQRQFLGPARPLHLDMTDLNAGVGMEGHRPFSILGMLLPPTLAVHGNEGLLGTVQRVWPLFLWRRYRISVVNDFGPGLTIDGVVWKPWTFPVTKGGRQVASILKKWSGGMRELFTDADTFMVRFEDSSLSATERRLLVATALAIDFDFFEKDA